MLNGCSLGFCYWDLPAAILLAAVGIVFVVQQRRHKKKDERTRGKRTGIVIYK